MDRNRLWSRLDDAVAKQAVPLPAPVFVVDLDDFDANADDLVRRAHGKPVRVASKSLRVPALIERALAHPAWRASSATPCARRCGSTTGASATTSWSPTPPSTAGRWPTCSPRRRQQPRSRSWSTRSPASTSSTRCGSGPAPRSASPSTSTPASTSASTSAAAHVGPKRSPLLDTDQVLVLAREIDRRPGFRLVGVMTYEGQVAGLQDTVPTARARSAVLRRVKALSVSQLRVRRRQIPDALASVAELGSWNGGGSGSVESTASDPVVTEIAAGSGLLVPTLSDHYRSFSPRPASYFGLPVTRKPTPEMATVHGGGLVASGPIGPDRLPTPWAPVGLHLTAPEGAGEVQTPLTGPAAAKLEIGDLVWFRHGRSGEAFEHTTTVHLLAGDAFEASVPSYRGRGQSF